MMENFPFFALYCAATHRVCVGGGGVKLGAFTLDEPTEKLTGIWFRALNNFPVTEGLLMVLPLRRVRKKI